MKVVIMVLARGKYSKRIPHKPLTMFCGKPLIDWTLEICDQLPHAAYVYTDMDEIKERCKIFSVHVRDKKYESETGIHETQKEIIEYNKELEADVIILLQVTSPLRKIELVKKWIEQFLKSDEACGIAAHELDDAYYYYKNGVTVNFYPENRTYNQDKSKKDKIYRETGSFYIFKFNQIHKNHFTSPYVSTNKYGIMIFKDPYNIDINTYQDIEIANEILCKENR
jgi:CMP-N-acetylneuraminic acid synthetase